MTIRGEAIYHKLIQSIQEDVTIKSIPNFITAVRIILSILLLFTAPMSGAFFIIYSLCGFSDILDGYIARKTNTSSKLGAVLDSIADFIFIAVTLIILIPAIHLELWMLIWLVLIAVVKTATLLTGFIKYRTVAFLHTLMNKLTGILLFCFLLFYYALGLDAAAGILLSMATLAAGEEFIITLTVPTFNPDRKSILKSEDK